MALAVYFELVYTFLWILRSKEWTWHVNKTILHKLSYITSKYNLIKCPSYIILCMSLIKFGNVYIQAKFSLKIYYDKWDICRFENKRGTNVNTKLGQEKPDREMCMCSLGMFSGYFGSIVFHIIHMSRGFICIDKLNDCFWCWRSVRIAVTIILKGSLFFVFKVVFNIVAHSKIFDVQLELVLTTTAKMLKDEIISWKSNCIWMRWGREAWLILLVCIINCVMKDTRP